MKGNILLIDDNPTDLKIAAGVLERVGYACFQFSEHVPALEWLALHRPTTVFLDLQMPGMSGFELIKLFRGSAATAKTPIIIMSGLNQAEDVRRAVELGASDYLVKPLDPLVIQEKMQKADAEPDEEFPILQLGTGSGLKGAFTRSFVISGLSEFGMQVSCKHHLNPGDTIEVGQLPREVFGTDQVVLRCLSVEKDPASGGYAMRFTFVGLTEGQRQVLRKSCRQMWVQQKNGGAA